MFEAIVAIFTLVIFVIIGIFFGRGHIVTPTVAHKAEPITAPITTPITAPITTPIGISKRKKVRFGKRKKIIKYDKVTGEVIGSEFGLVL